MKIEIEADVVIALAADLSATAGSQLVIADGRIVAVLPPTGERITLPEREAVAPPVAEPAAPPAAEAEAQRYIDDVLGVLRARGPATTQELANYLGLPPGPPREGLGRALRRLALDGRIKSVLSKVELNGGIVYDLPAND